MLFTYLQCGASRPFFKGFSSLHGGPVLRSQHALSVKSCRNLISSCHPYVTSATSIEFSHGNAFDSLNAVPPLSKQFRKARSLHDDEGAHLAENVGGTEQADEETTEQLQEAVARNLQNEEYDALLPALLRLSQRPEALESLSSTFLAESIHSLKPQHFIDPAKLAYHGMHPTIIQSLHGSMRQLRDIFFDYTQSLRVLTGRMRRAGKKFRLREYTTLMDAARATGDARLALYLRNCMREDEIELDTTCYNYFFESLSWDKGHEPIESYKLRVTAWNLKNQSIRDRVGALHYHRISAAKLKTIFIRAYEEMVQNGISSNATTYCLFMQALSRSGELDFAKLVMQKIWDIDVDKVMNDEDETAIFECDLDRSSPLFPNQELLFTIAHIFGSNNQMSTALRLVDHVARKYDLEIDSDVWMQLAQWTFVLSKRRGGRNLERKESDSVGQLPIDSFEQLWRTMTSEPYNLQPDELLYNMRIRSLRRRNLRHVMIQVMEEIRDLLASGNGSRLTLQEKWASQSFAGSRFEQELEHVIRSRNLKLLFHWTKLVLGNNAYSSGWLSWKIRGIPNFLKSWFPWASVGNSAAAYSIATGRVQFHPNIPGLSIRVTMEMFESSSNELIVRPIEHCHEQPHRGLTRCVRKTRRWNAIMEKRNFSPYKDDDDEDPAFREPSRKIIPEWHETEEVKDWAPLLQS